MKLAKPILVSLGATIVAVLIWLICSVATMETDLTLNQTYELPESKSLENFYTMDGGSYAVAIDGALAAGENETATQPTASTAKMILGLAIMREKPFNLNESGETITIDKEAYERYLYYANNGGSCVTVRLGEEISEYDALMAVFLASANNLADTLALWAFGSLENYRDYAEAMLAEWGLVNTTIGADASGFSPTTTSTAAELALIGQKVLENPVLKEIVGTKNYTIPVAGTITNTNGILGQNNIIGIKTGWIGDASGYCLISGYLEGDHIITVAQLGAATRNESFEESLEIVRKMQGLVQETAIIRAGDVVGYYESWWTGAVPIKAENDVTAISWMEAERELTIEMDGATGELKLKIGNASYTTKVTAEAYEVAPSLGEKIAHVFGWRKEAVPNIDADEEPTEQAGTSAEAPVPESGFAPITNVPSENCTFKYGYLMLINPNFTVTTDFIDARRGELVSLSSLYGIVEGNPYNGDNLLDAEAAAHINEMIKAYETDYPGHTMETRSCYRARGTTCGRLCAATGTSDHHTGLTCDLLDPAYGTGLDTDTYDQHIDWQWLKANSYKYGFIDRFPAAWAGGPMSEPANVDENGSTGLFETWHYRYVGVGPATEIATGKYNNGEYDSLEHYLKARGLVNNLKLGTCE